MNNSKATLMKMLHFENIVGHEEKNPFLDS